MSRPSATTGLRHVALYVEDLAACAHFYTHLLGMEIEWQPDDDNIYLTSGNDNLALHRAQHTLGADGQKLDHVGFILAEIDDVDAWHEFFVNEGVTITAKPRTHRDGARSFYCLDPDGTNVQMIYHPPLAGR